MNGCNAYSRFVCSAGTVCPIVNLFHWYFLTYNPFELCLSSHLRSYPVTIAVGDCVEVNCDVKGQDGPVSSYGRVVDILCNELDHVKKARVSWFYSKQELVELMGPRCDPFLPCLEPHKNEVYLSAHSELFSLECVARKTPQFPCLCLACAEDWRVQISRRRKSFPVHFYRTVVDMANGITSGNCEKCGQPSFCLDDRESSVTPASSINTVKARNMPRSSAKPPSKPKDLSLQPRLCASARPTCKFASPKKNADNTSNSGPQCKDNLSTITVEKTPSSKRRKLCTEENVLASLTEEKTPVKQMKRTTRSTARRKLDLDDSDNEDPIFNIKDHVDSEDPFEFNSESEDDKDFASPPLRHKTTTPSRQGTRERGRRHRPNASKTPLAYTPGRGNSKKKISPLTLAKQSYSEGRLKNVTLSLPKRSAPKSVGMNDYQLAQER